MHVCHAGHPNETRDRGSNFRCDNSVRNRGHDSIRTVRIRIHSHSNRMDNRRSRNRNTRTGNPTTTESRSHL